MNKRYSIFLLIPIFLILSVNNTQGDIALMPGVEVEDTIMYINITVSGNSSTVSVDNTYTLRSLLDESYTDTMYVKEPTSIDSFFLSEGRNITTVENETQVSLSYNNFIDHEERTKIKAQYNFTSDNFGGVRFAKIFDSFSYMDLWEIYVIRHLQLKVIINSNVDIDVKTYKDVEIDSIGNRDYTIYFPFNFSEMHHIDDVDTFFDNYLYSYNTFYDYMVLWDRPMIPIEIKWNESKNFTIYNKLYASISEKHHSHIPELINKETVMINIENFNGIKYSINGSFQLNQTVTKEYFPFSLWFPENGSMAKGNMAFQFEYYNRWEDHYWYYSEKVDTIGKKNNRNGQNGFYFSFSFDDAGPYLNLEDYRDRLYQDPFFNTTINGEIIENHFDFDIVTIPQYNSSITFYLPMNFNITNITSSYEYNIISTEEIYNKIEMFGNCSSLGKIQIKWEIQNDTDGDYVPDLIDIEPNNPNIWKECLDNCTNPYLLMREEEDNDQDGIYDFYDIDDDNDGIIDDNDDFPYNESEWTDTDKDGIGNNIDRDIGGDGVNNANDYYPYDYREWSNIDGDGWGDNADPDIDGDGHYNDVDKFPYDYNRWADTDDDGIEDEIDPDIDGDGIDNADDFFPMDGEEWLDYDGDGLGDNTDLDKDGDGCNNGIDDFPLNHLECSDTDNDGIGDNSDIDIDGDGYNNSKDIFPYRSSEYADFDGDGKGDSEDNDDDNDGVNDEQDVFPNNKNETGDMDDDGIGDNSDPDRDGDNVPNIIDKFPDHVTEWNDTDEDGIGDNTDYDIDGDNVPNFKDKFPNNVTEWNDTDEDGIGDNTDTDRDGDNVLNIKDKFPNNATEWSDLDDDGIGDNTDGDRDGDGHNNDNDTFPDDPVRWEEESEPEKKEEDGFLPAFSTYLLLISLLLICIVNRDTN